MAKPDSLRLQALSEIRDHHGVSDFKARNLSGLTLPDSGWKGIDLTEAKLRDTDIDEANFQGAKLIRADLSGAHCRLTDFRESELNGAVMIGALCNGASFEDVMLRYGRYENANFENANFDNAWLQLADFQGANFTRARLRYSSLNEANITNAVFDGADLTGVSFIAVIGIETASFLGAFYNSETDFPKGFDPISVGMIERSD